MTCNGKQFRIKTGFLSRIFLKEGGEDGLVHANSY